MCPTASSPGALCSDLECPFPESRQSRALWLWRTWVHSAWILSTLTSETPTLTSRRGSLVLTVRKMYNVQQEELYIFTPLLPVYLLEDPTPWKHFSSSRNNKVPTHLKVLTTVLFKRAQGEPVRWLSRESLMTWVQFLGPRRCQESDQTLKLSFTLYIASWLFHLSRCH